MLRACLAKRGDIDAERNPEQSINEQNGNSRKTDMHEWPFEHLGTSPSHQDPSTSEEEQCQRRGYRVDECIGAKIRFELLGTAFPGITSVFIGQV